MDQSTEKKELMKDLEYLFVDMTQGKKFVRDATIIAHGQGSIVTDIDGKDYIDGLSGIWVVNIGHGNKVIIDAMVQQLRKFSFSFPVGTINAPAIRLARLLREITPPSLTHVKLLNSGSEATEAVLKLARQYFLQTGRPRKIKTISRYLSWHGATLGALSMSGVPGLKTPFEPLMGGCLHMAPPHCYRCPYGLCYPNCNVVCARIIEKVIEWEGADTVAMIIVDPVMVSAGILVPPPEYLKLLREICDRHDILLVFDEVITGFGRTGNMFAMDTFDVVPDIAAIAKGMSSGYAPLSGFVASRVIGEAFWGEAEDEIQFQHGHTFGANPLSSTAGLVNIQQILENDLIENANRVGAYMQAQAQSLYDLPIVGDVRGVGMMLGVELVADRETREPFPVGVGPGLEIQAAGKQRGMLMRASANWVALGPPIISTEGDIDIMLSILRDSIRQVQDELSN